ncbi:MAG: class I SAM-dependent methyltransferase [Polyangia bacterium]
MADEVRPCPSCGARKSGAPLNLQGKLNVAGQPMQLVRCLECGLQFQPDDFDDDTLARWYGYMGNVPRVFEISALLERRLQHQLAPLSAFQQTGRLLDIGCGSGALLRVAEKFGWEPYGIDVSASCVAALRPWLGERLHEGPLTTTTPFERRTFDVVVLSEVVEHLTDPAALLMEARSLLRSGGALWVTTPNRDGLSGRLLGEDWRVVGDEHLNYYTARTLRLLLERTGYSIRSIWTSGFDPQTVRALLRKRARPARTAMPATTALPQAPWPPPFGLLRHSRGARVKALLASSAYDIINTVALTTRLGDGLRAIAIAR